MGRMARIQTTTSTNASPDLRAAASPSWSSATTATSAPGPPPSAFQHFVAPDPPSASVSGRPRRTASSRAPRRSSSMTATSSGSTSPGSTRVSNSISPPSASISPQATGTGGGARAAYAGLMLRHQEAQLRQALDQRQAEADAAMTAAYHQHHQEQVEQAAHFYHHQQQQAQELEERRIEEERYHLQQLHQQQQAQAQAYLDPYAHPHPHHAMGMGGMLEMGMMEGYPQAQPHPGNMDSLDMERAAAYHAHHHIESAGDSPELAYPGDSISRGYHTHAQHSHPHHPPAAPLETSHTHALEAAAAGSPVSPYSVVYPHTPQLQYSYAAETMGGFGMLGRPEDMATAVKFEGSSPLGMGMAGLDADLGLLDMNMNMSMSMGIGLGVGGAVG
ncbi:hypothetical protein B0H12DRAFT_1160682 [Mycena haematopus]|nr:hypothetical protein B0H12DRAFT_1160682 [Mycena haematopus]